MVRMVRSLADRTFQPRFGWIFGLQFLLLGLFTPLLVAYLYCGGFGKIPKADIPLFLGCGLAYGVSQFVVAGFGGPQLPCLFAGLSVFLLIAGAEYFRATKEANE